MNTEKIRGNDALPGVYCSGSSRSRSYTRKGNGENGVRKV